MHKSELLKILKLRRENLQRRRDDERLAANRLKYKSRRVRLASPLHKRIGWYTDRLGEVDLVIELIEGKLSKERYSTHLAGDELDLALAGLGNSVG